MADRSHSRGHMLNCLRRRRFTLNQSTALLSSSENHVGLRGCLVERQVSRCGPPSGRGLPYVESHSADQQGETIWVPWLVPSLPSSFVAERKTNSPLSTAPWLVAIFLMLGQNPTSSVETNLWLKYSSLGRLNIEPRGLLHTDTWMQVAFDRNAEDSRGRGSVVTDV